MAKPPRTAISGTFFTTAVTNLRRRRFRVDANARIVLDTLQRHRLAGHYKLHAFVVMPDHMHLLLTTENIPEAMKLIKGGASYELASNFPVWQPGFTDHEINSREEFESRRNYIHQNPVRAGLVERAEDYPYSSAYRGGR